MSVSPHPALALLDFERRIQLPDVRLEAGTREFTDGCLILRLRKAEPL